MNSLSIQNLSKTYENGTKAIDDLSLEITNGMFGLLGPNGAGKSTLMRTIAALQESTSGIIEFNGINILENPIFIRQNLGYLPQEFGVYPKISAYRLLDHLAVLKGIVDKKERHDQILYLLQQTNLLQHKDKAVHSFSGGMRQRFGIAQALLGNPKIIIVDEPTAGLDPEERNRFNNLLSEIGESIIVVLSTHIVEDVRDLCPKMAIISNGKLILEGKPNEAIDSLKDKIWMKAIEKAELKEHQLNFNIISSNLNSGKINIHVFSDERPDSGFELISPDLSDVYFSVLAQNQLKN
ncbi:ABC-type multidrug transport system, ATPase component [Flavobacterium sp. CF108]|uniref:ABC transporter ATP-binding protein n=1 Tax=unclassified Flavobacterium TaxID=196869 RepID=UPI0008C8BC0A|nr:MULTISPECIES: ABC transporter ATP-binding protein [unclassified Flavobacterium]SEP20830.1 ABC-type multidrug transport system, ATPase component [Flavobacterium sp. fv08]SHI09118.1 ABC-type multidrug transport system, ATPase component [Flavobacterium sp. CF108]